MLSLPRVSPDVSQATFSVGAGRPLPSTNSCGRIQFLVVLGQRSPLPCWPPVRGHFQPLTARPWHFLPGEWHTQARLHWGTASSEVKLQSEEGHMLLTTKARHRTTAGVASVLAEPRGWGVGGGGYCTYSVKGRVSSLRTGNPGGKVGRQE